MADSARIPQRAAPRRAAILETARRLFAEHGIGPVTTNRIAEEAGISPGNLYYWFPSKAEIVRALFADWSARMRISDEPAHPPSDALRMLWYRVTELPQPDPDYAFFLRDLLPLLHADPVLAQAYRDTYAARRDELVALVDELVGAGLIRAPEPPTTVRSLVSLLWLAAEMAHPFAEAVQDELVDARRYGRAVMQPLLTDAGRRLVGLSERTEPDDDR